MISMKESLILNTMAKELEELKEMVKSIVDIPYTKHDILDWLEQLPDQNKLLHQLDNMFKTAETRTITCVVEIGKSKKPTAYTFLMKDFERIEDDKLYLKNDDRRLRISFDTVKQILLQMNNF